MVTIVDPSDYDMVIEQLEAEGMVDLKTKFALSTKVFKHTSEYDTLVYNYMNKQQ